MPANYLPDLVKGTVAGVRFIKANATSIRTENGMGVDRLLNFVRSMRETDLTTFAAVAALGSAATINTVILRYVDGWGATPATNLGNIRTALTNLYNAVGSAMGSLQNPVSIGADGSTVYLQLTRAQLDTINPQIDALLAAIAPLE